VGAKEGEKFREAGSLKFLPWRGGTGHRLRPSMGGNGGVLGCLERKADKLGGLEKEQTKEMR